MGRNIVTARELGTLMGLVAHPDDADSPESLPPSILHGLRALIPCDAVVFVQFDAQRRTVSFNQEVGDPDGISDERWVELVEAFWAHYWNSIQCCYPDVSGDLTTVTTASDFLSDRQLRSTAMYSEYLRHFQGDREMMLCLPSEPGRVIRLLFWRGPGPDFTTRDRSLLTLLRPHLFAAFEEHGRRRRQLRDHGVPALTVRQNQILQMVAAGYTNGQIGTRLFITESTVRKHLEHIFERLQVPSRAAAVSRAFHDRSH